MGQAGAEGLRIELVHYCPSVGQLFLTGRPGFENPFEKG